MDVFLSVNLRLAISVEVHLWKNALTG